MWAGPTGIEPATPGLKVRCSSLTELRTPLKLLRTDRKMRRGFLAFLLEIEVKKIGYWIICAFRIVVMKLLILSWELSMVSIVFAPFSVSL